MYPPNHPYHWPTIGSHADLEAATVADVRAFFERFYRPSNASLVVAGDFDPAEARRLVDRYFGWQPQLPPPARAPQPATPRARARRPHRADRSRAAAAPAPQLAFARAVRVRRRRPGHGRARAGRRQVEPPLQIAGLRQAHRPGRVRVSELAAARQPVSGRRDRQAGARPRRAGRRDRREMDRLAADGPTEAELARARNTHLADFYKSLDHLQTRADLLNHYQHVLGDPGRRRRATWPATSRRRSRRCATPSRASPRPATWTCASRPSPPRRVRRAGDRLTETPASMAEAPAVGPLPAVALPRATRFSLSQRPRGRRPAARRRADRVGGVHVPQRRRLRSAGTGRAGVDRGGDARRRRGRARRAGHRRGAGAAGRRPVAGERARRLAAVDAGAARDLPGGDGDRRRHPDPPAAGAGGLAARSQRPAHGRRPAPRSARGGRERRLGSDAVRRRPSRTASRSTGWSGRSTRSRWTTCARFTPPTTGPNHASLVVAGDFDEATLQAELESAAGRLEAGAAAAGAAPAALADAARAWCWSIARARPRASCGWSRPASIVSRRIGPGCRC